MKTLIVLSASACIALALAGAGSASTARELGYVAQMQPVDRQLTRVLLTLKKLAATSVIYPAKPHAAIDAANAVVKQRATLRTTGTKLATITPPTSIAARHAQLLSATRLLDTQLGRSLKRLRQGWLVDAAKLPGLSGARRIAAALTAIERKGYPLGSR